MTQRTVRQAATYIRKEIKYGRSFLPGYCKQESREAYLILSDGSPDAKTASQRTQHRFTDKWMWGVFMWFRIGEHWHVAITTFRKDVIFTTDNGHLGRWNRRTMHDFYAEWPEAEFLFFSLDIDGKSARPMPKRARKWKSSRA